MPHPLLKQRLRLESLCGANHAPVFVGLQDALADLWRNEPQLLQYEIHEYHCIWFLRRLVGNRIFTDLKCKMDFNKKTAADRRFPRPEQSRFP